MSDTDEDKTEEINEEQQTAPASSTEEPAEAKPEDDAAAASADAKSQADADKESPAETAAKSSVEDGPASKAKSGIDDDGPKSKAKSGVEDAPKSKAKSGIEEGGAKSKAKSGVEDGPASKAKSGVEDGPKSKAKSGIEEGGAKSKAKSGVEDGPASKAKSGVEDGPKSKAKSGVEDGASASGTQADSKSKAAASDEKPRSSVEDGPKSKAKSGIEEGGAKSKAKSGVEEVGKTKSQAGGAAVSSTKSGIQEGGKSKSQAAAAPKAKSGIEATKSGTKSEVKATKSRDSNKRRSSTASTGSQDRKPSRTSSKVNDVSEARIGFVGAGRMTDSIVRGLLKAEKTKPKQIFVAAKTSKNLDTFKSQGITTSTRSYDVFGKFDCDIVFLCIHGFVVRNCFKFGGTRPAPFTTNYIPSRKRTTYILSLIGGVPLEDVKLTLLNPEADKHNVEMHRLVMNTSVAYGLGIGALDVEIDSQKCHPLVRDTLQSIASIVVACSDQMDSICTVMGSGLALTYYFIGALADGGFKMGLHRPIAIKLATKAMQCAAQSLLETGKSPTELRDSVTSASGPSIYGLNVLDKSDCNSGIQTAVEAAYKRLKELVEVAN